MARGSILWSRSLLVCLPVLGVLVTGACSGSDGPKFDSTSSRLDQLAAVLARGEGANIRGTLSLSGGQQYEVSGAWTGASVATGSGSIVAPIQMGAETVSTSVRWAKGATFYKRSTGVTVSGPFRQFVARTAAEKVWLRVPSGALSSQLVAPYIPTEAVELVQRLGGGLTAGSKESGTREVRSKNAISLVSGAPKAQVQLWLNERNELVRLRYAPSGLVVDYSISDWGRPQIEPAPAPAESAILSGTVAEIEQPSGAFVNIREGTDQGFRWRLEQAPGTGGSTCWRLTSTPAIGLLGGAPDHRCVRAYRPDIDDLETAVRFVLVDDGASGFEMMAAVLPKGASNVRLGYVESATLTAVNDEVVVAIGRSRSGPGYLGVQLADGTELDCGRGGIATAADLRDSQLLGNIAGTPWSCQIA